MKYPIWWAAAIVLVGLLITNMGHHERNDFEVCAYLAKCKDGMELTSWRPVQ